ncbi:MAG: arginine--tRNA ligase [Cyanobacteria bacterium J06642_3]
MKSILEVLQIAVKQSLVASFGEEYADTDPLVNATNNPKFGDYQANVALSLSKKLKQAPRAIAETIIANLDVADIAPDPQIAGPGFINFTLKADYLAGLLKEIQQSDRLGIEAVAQAEKIVVDFSSPNIAKEMHVGHLRSTIIGDSIARILEFQGYDVLRLNHVGDWGTQFGMLIAYLREAYPEALTTADALDIGDLVSLYKKAKVRFDEDAEFKETARQEVVKLQEGAEDSRHAWKLLCDQSRREFQVIYDLLDINLTERGESFYNPFLEEVVTKLDHTGLLEEDAGAKCVFLEGFSNKDGEPLPLIVQKSDGGFNYATTDLAAINYRVSQDQASRIVYVTDAGQANHFAGVFQVATRAGILPTEVEVVHVPFGLVLGEDGKRLKTRSGETVKLKELLDEAVNLVTQDTTKRLQEEERTETPEFIDNVAKVVGISAVKYADLSLKRTTDYRFSYDTMLELKGNTAPYMLYAYVRVQGISRKGDIDYSELSGANILLEEESELNLTKHLLQLTDVLKEVERDLLPNRLCQYLFELSQKFNQFYDRCDILKAAEPQRTSRLILADLTARTLKLGLSLLGIPVLERM